MMEATFSSPSVYPGMIGMARSTESYLITGSHKYSLVGNYEYAKISQFTGIITDDRRLAETQKIKELGVRVI